MTAMIYPVWNAYCGDCAEGSGPHEDAEDAETWQQQHDAEHHQRADQ